MLTVAMMRWEPGYLVNASDDTVAETFFDQGPTCGTDWDTASVLAPASGDYYLEFRSASFDGTGEVLSARKWTSTT